MDENNPVNQEPLEKQKLEQLENELENIGSKTTQEIPPQPSQPAQQTNTPQPISPVLSADPKPQGLGKSKGILWIGIVLMALALVGVGAYHLGSQKNANTITSEPVQTQTPTSTPDPTASWKVFSDADLGFSLKIPQDWEVREITPNLQIEIGPIASPSESIILGYTNSLPGSALSVEELRNTGFEVSESMMSIDGKTISRKKVHTTLAVISPESLDEYMDQVIIPMPNGLEIQLKIIELKYETIFNQILSTFKFIDEQSFVCPEETIIDCVPSVDGPMEKYCAPDYAEWIGENCSDMKITY